MPDRVLELDNKCVHVFSVETDAPDQVVSHFELLLAAEETHRAAKFRVPHARREFIVSRGTLRLLLSRYLGVPARDIAFRYAPNGKPELAPQTLVQFSVSHSGNLTALAFARDCPVGIDIEQIRDMPDLFEIASRFFFSGETAEIANLVGSERERAFFKHWTRKEACVKATGEGLSAMPDASSDWLVHDLAIAPDCAAALAYRGPGRPVLTYATIQAVELLEAIPNQRREARNNAKPG